MIITNNACERYLERVVGVTLREAEACGLSIEAAREAIRCVPGLEPAVRAGAKAYSSQGVVFLIRGEAIVTVQAGQSPSQARADAERGKHGRDVRLRQSQRFSGRNREGGRRDRFVDAAE